jgi:lysophospholipase L1-like esterase
MVSREGTDNERYRTGKTNILCVLCGLNDMAIAGSGSTQCFDTLKAYCQTMRATGWKIVLLTLLPTDPSLFVGLNLNTKIAAVNTSIRGDASFYDALADIAGDATMGNVANTTNLTYYADGIHPTATGQALLAPYVTAAVQTLYP